MNEDKTLDKFWLRMREHAKNRVDTCPMEDWEVRQLESQTRESQEFNNYCNER